MIKEKDGWKESTRKKGLFFKLISDKIIMFLDFRDIVIDSFYFQIKEKIDPKEYAYYNKTIIEEFFKIRKETKKYISFDNLLDCVICGKRTCMGETCSKKCGLKLKGIEAKESLEHTFKKFKERDRLKCKICNKKPNLQTTEYYKGVKELGVEYVLRHDHHLDYRKGKEKTINICPSCHAKITFHLKKYPELKNYEPKGKRKEFLDRKRVKRVCSICKKNTLEPRDKKNCSQCRERLKRTTESNKGMGTYSNIKRWNNSYMKSPMLKAWLKD